jgi:transposase
MSSKCYPEEFKVEAVKQVTERGHSVAEVASRLNKSSEYQIT